MAIKLSTVARNAAANAVVDLADDGYIRIYDGTQAANPQTAIGSQVLLAELRFGTPAFGAAATGTATAEAITADVNANNTGTATWFRVLQSDGTTVLWDGTVSTSGADLNLASGTSITSGDNIAIDSMTYTQPES
jgi:hypothetical protein